MIAVSARLASPSPGPFAKHYPAAQTANKALAVITAAVTATPTQIGTLGGWTKGAIGMSDCLSGKMRLSAPAIEAQ